MESIKRQAINPRMIKAVRDKVGMSQEALAKELGCNQSAISRIERGTEIPDWLERFIKLSRLVHQAGLSWEDVIMEFPEPSPRVAEPSTTYHTD